MTNELNCRHCDLPIPAGVKIYEGNNTFCCQACKVVHEFIAHSHLDEYYTVKSSLGMIDKRRARTVSKNGLALKVDQEDFQKTYLLSGTAEKKSMKFFIDGLHCFACVWLLEKLPTIVPSLLDVRVNYFEKSLVLSVPVDGGFAAGVEAVQRFGYSLYPVSSGSELEKIKLAKQKELLQRVGTAAVFGGNIMICAVAVYAGADGTWRTILDGLSGVFFLPILFHTASPVLKNAWSSLVARQYSLDIAAAFSVIFGSVISYYHLIRGSGEIYFDSLAAFLLLLTFSRYALARSNNRAAHLDTIDHRLTNETYFKYDLDTGVKTRISLKDVRVGDVISLDPGDICPVDGSVWQGESHFDNSAITGESRPVFAASGARVSSGARNLETSVLIRCTSTQAESSLNILIENISRNWKKNGVILGVSERLSFYLFGLVFLAVIATAGVLIGAGHPEPVLARVLAILVVACPCALGIGAPLALGYSLKSLVQRGILVKDADVLLKAARAETIFFDKTGTLTHGNYTLIAWEGMRNEELENIVYNLETISAHPIAQGLLRGLSETRSIASLSFDDHRECAGGGVEGRLGADLWTLGRADTDLRVARDFPQASICELKKNGDSIATLYMGDKTKLESFEALQALRGMGLRLGLLSGDRQSVVTHLANALGFDERWVVADLSPQEKLDRIRGVSNSVMVGDGINDAPALAAAGLGIAVKGSLGASLKSSDVILLESDLRKVPYLLKFSRDVMGLIRQTLVWALVYNFASVGLAAFGFISPLAAAILMPLSSLGVVFNITWFFARYDRKSELAARPAVKPALA